MKLFNCQHCDAMLFFENRSCGRCGHAVGFLPERGVLSAIETGADGRLIALADGSTGVRACANAEHDVCNWLIAPGSDRIYCQACRHNRIVPLLFDEAQRNRWLKLEIAKHRMVYSLIRLGIDLPDRTEDPVCGLAFDFLDEVPGGPAVMTGHGQGVITIAVREADDAVREEQRHQMRETYRTLLGHFRHEVGHWIWMRLVRDGGELDNCRALFGDDTQDYRTALDRHYRSGPPPDWQFRTITAYASSHPWEDFAETWAHYLHIMDTLETAAACRVHIAPVADHDRSLTAAIELDPYETDDLRPILDAWLPLVFAVNNLNRSMGLEDLYPFIIGGPVRDKLAFIHRIAGKARRRSGRS